MHQRWVPCLVEVVHCDQPAPKQWTIPCLKLIVNYCIKHRAFFVNNLYIIYILSWPHKKHQKTLSRPLHSNLKKIQGLFKDLHRNLRTFQGLPLKFKDFSRLCEPCDHREGAVKSQEPRKCPKTAPYMTSVSEHTKREAERRGKQNVCAWQTWQGYYLRVLSWSSINLAMLWSYKEIFCKEARKVKFGGRLFKHKYCHAVTKGLPSSFPRPPFA